MADNERQIAEYVAVIGNGSWGGRGAAHGALKGSEEAIRPDRPHDIRFTSLCGQRYLFLPGGQEQDFVTDRLGMQHKCKRCLSIIEKRSQNDRSGAE